MSTFFENRKHSRINVRIPIRYDVAKTGASHMGEIINLSDNGAYLATTACLDIGNKITLRLNHLLSDKAALESGENGYLAAVKTCHILPKSGDYSYGMGIMLQQPLPDKDWVSLFPPFDSQGKKPINGIHSLRQRAENFLSRNPQGIFRIKPENIQQLVHELYIHQVELQMQGEELRHSQHDTEQALSKYADLYDFAPLGYFTMNHVGKIERVNMAGAALLGFERGRLVQKTLASFVAKEDQDLFWRHLRAVLNTASRQTCDIKLRNKKTGGIVNVHLQSAIDPDENDAEQKIFTAITDTTERKVLEDRLSEARKMEAIGILAGGVAHDFNNLMMIIQGSVSVMRMGLGEDHILAEHLVSIDDQIRSASSLTRQMLAFAQGGKYQVQPTDINDLVQSGLSLFSRTRKDILTHTELQDNLPAVAADSAQIEQVFLNLFINAGHAMSNGGQLTIQTTSVPLNERQIRTHDLPSGIYVRIMVTDTGTGMDEATTKRIFEPFFTTRKLHRGTGLGLASAYGTIRNHKGLMEVLSQPEKGTTFTIFLPATDAKAVKSSEIGPAVHEGNGTILVVDDEPVLRKVVSQMLEHLGYEVLLAGSGEEAIAHYRKDRDRIDLVLLDMTMPGLDGGQTFKRLREIDPEVQVLLASGYSRQGKAEEIIEQGCSGFIQKPYTLNALSQTLHALLNQADKREELNG